MTHTVLGNGWYCKGYRKNDKVINEMNNAYSSWPVIAPSYYVDESCLGMGAPNVQSDNQGKVIEDVTRANFESCDLSPFNSTLRGWITMGKSKRGKVRHGRSQRKSSKS